MPVFEPSEGIFDRAYVLSEDYIPDVIRGRDEDIQRYKNLLQPIMDGRDTKSILLYGKTGVGKTVTTRYLTQHLERDINEYHGINLNTIWVLCENINTSYQLAGAIINEIREPENHITPTGYPSEQMFRMMYDELDSLGEHVIIVLDEVDNIGTDDKLLYELPRAGSNNRLQDTKITVIGISNDLRFTDNLRQKVKSSLAQRELQFPPYDANELNEILRDRAEIAFHDGVIENGVIELCSAISANDVGDARQGLDILTEAGEIANREDSEVVTEEHVYRARDALEQDLINDSIGDLTTQGKLVLCSILYFERSNETPVRSKDVYDKYIKLAEYIDTSPVTQRRVRDHLGDLKMQSLILESTKNTGRQEGRYKEYKSYADVDSAISELDKDGTMEPIVELLEALN
jgi:cell division control protein 6